MTDTYVDEEQVRKGLVLLWISLAGSILMVPGLMSSKLMVLFLVAWVASFFGGLGGIREVSRGTNGSPLLMFLMMVAVFMPLFNVVAAGFYILVGRAALRRAEEPVPAPAPAPRSVQAPANPARASFKAPETPEEKAAAAAGSWSRQRIAAGGAKAFVSSAIACIRHADLRGAGGSDLKEGSRLRLKFDLPPGSPALKPMDEPILRVAHGTFGVAYLVDLGDHYTWVTVGHLVEAKLTLDDLHRIGLENLQRKTDRLMVMEGDEAQMLAMGGDFEASVLLLDAPWEKGGVLAGYAPNGVIATIPARDVCAFCDARSAKGLEGLRKVATNPLAEPKYALSPKLFARVDGRWRELGAEAARPRDLPPLELR